MLGTTGLQWSHSPRGAAVQVVLAVPSEVAALLAIGEERWLRLTSCRVLAPSWRPAQGSECSRRGYAPSP